MLKLYNTLTRKKQIFKPIKKTVSIYSCGLTIYNHGHIGNYRAFVSSDILTRYLQFKNYKTKKVVNITDVDDKTIKNSIQKKLTLKQYTKEYEKSFFQDEKILNIQKADYYPKATQHIEEMVKLISKLLKKEYAYKTEDGIYFKVSKYKKYGKLANIKLKSLKEGARIDKDEYDKASAKDFALWKFYTKEDGKVFWNTKIGKGRPGWHIECSAMASKYLGQPFDIHTGGIDLVFPHHENEIAQSECANNKKLANYWIHNEWIMSEGKKMSKSLGNYYTIKDLVKEHSPMAIRYLYLTGHYRSQLNFTLKGLKSAENSYKRLKNIISELKDDKKENKTYIKNFTNAMDNDLDTPKALAILWKLIRDPKSKGQINTIKQIDEVLGLNLLKKERISIPKEIKDLANKRETARKNKDYNLADKLRDKIKSKGFILEDSKEGLKIKKI